MIQAFKSPAVLAGLFIVLWPHAAAVPASGPALTVVFIVDGLSADLFEDAAPGFTSGFREFHVGGRYYEAARHPHAATLTGPGHATLMTGAPPRVHGIVANRWIDRSGKSIYSAGKPNRPSANHLVVPTVGDRFLKETRGKGRVFCVGGKDRSAVLAGGRLGTVYYYAKRHARFERSGVKKYPEWWKRYYRSLARYGIPASYPEDDLTAHFTHALIEGESLGRNPNGPDLLIVCLSSLDLYSHRYGPSSRYAREQLKKLDGLIGGMMSRARASASGPVVFALSSDHGFADGAKPVYQIALSNRLKEHLEAKGKRKAVRGWSSPFVYVKASVAKEAAAFLEKEPGIRRAIVPSQLRPTSRGEFESEVYASYFPGRSGEVFLVPEPGFMLVNENDANAATHGSPHDYDRRVPMAFLGPGFTRGRVEEPVTTLDFAPTIARSLGMDSRVGEGRALQDASAAR